MECIVCSLHKEECDVIKLLCCVTQYDTKYVCIACVSKSNPSYGIKCPNCQGYGAFEQVLRRNALCSLYACALRNPRNVSMRRAEAQSTNTRLKFRGNADIISASLLAIDDNDAVDDDSHDDFDENDNDDEENDSDAAAGADDGEEAADRNGDSSSDSTAHDEDDEGNAGVNPAVGTVHLHAHRQLSSHGRSLRFANDDMVIEVSGI